MGKNNPFGDEPMEKKKVNPFGEESSARAEMVAIQTHNVSA